MASTLFPAGTPAADAASSDNPLVMALPDGSIVAAPTLADVLDAVIPGYADTARVNEAAAFKARVAFARQFAATRTAMFARALAGDLPEEARLGGEPILPAQVPFVLVSIDYAPFGARPAPDGAIEWINPITEMTLLESMHATGDYTLSVSVAAPAGGDRSLRRI